MKNVGGGDPVATRIINPDGTPFDLPSRLSAVEATGGGVGSVGNLDGGTPSSVPIATSVDGGGP